MARMKNRDANRKRREDRQVQAKVRQGAYDMMTLEEKLAKADPAGSKRERAKLVKLMDEMVAKSDAHIIEPARSVGGEVVEGVEALAKERKGVKAKRQARKHKTHKNG